MVTGILTGTLLSSEDTAFQMDVLAQCNNLLVIGAVLCSMYAASYNRCFEYSKMATTNDIDAKVKRRKGMLIILLQRYSNLRNNFPNGSGRKDIKSICVAASCAFFGAQLSESNIDTDFKAVEHCKLSVKPPYHLT